MNQKHSIQYNRQVRQTYNILCLPKAEQSMHIYKSENRLLILNNYVLHIHLVPSNELNFYLCVSKFSQAIHLRET